MKNFLSQMWRMMSFGLESFDLNQRRRSQRIDTVKKDMDAWRGVGQRLKRATDKVMKQEVSTWNW